MTTSDQPPQRGEEELRDVFSRAGTSVGTGTGTEELLGRIVTAALRRRRRSSALTVAGAAASSIAVVAALVVGPTLLRSDREVAGPASGTSSTLTDATGTSTDAATTAPIEATATVSAPATSFSDASTPPDTEAPIGPAGTTPTAPSSRMGGGTDPYAGLLQLFPEPSSLGTGLTWELEPTKAGSGAAPVLGLQICDSSAVTRALGTTGFAAAEQQAAAAIGSARARDGSPTVDISMVAWPPKHGPDAFDQLTANTGMCVWHTSPTVKPWSGRTGLLVTGTTAAPGTGRTAAAVQLVGDVTVGVTVIDIDLDTALSRAQTACDAIAEKVRASGIGQG